MRRWSLLLALLAGCEAPAKAPPAPTTEWVAPPLPAAWTGVPGASIGRGQAPQLVAFGGIAGNAAPLTNPVVWQVPGEARAVIGGLLAGKRAVDLVEIDTGRLVWRDTTSCVGTIVGVSKSAIVCADGGRIVAIGIDGKQRWAKDATYAAMIDEHVVLDLNDEAIVLGAGDGRELARWKLSSPVSPDEIVEICDSEIFASTIESMLVRFVDGRGDWVIRLLGIAEVDGCGAQVHVTLEDNTVVTLDRATGKEISRARPRKVIAQRGTLRLEQAGPLTALLFDDKGGRAYLPFAYRSAALGETALVASGGTGSSGHQVRRLLYPARETRALALHDATPYIAVPAELRDVPTVVPASQAPIATTLARATPFTALEGTMLYAVTVGIDEGTPSGIAAFDARTKAWSWQRDDACGVGGVVGFAVANDRMFCALRTEAKGVVRAASRDKTLWEWTTANIDSVSAAGSLVLVSEADRLHVLEATTGKWLGTLASDAGDSMPGAMLDLDLLVTAERNRVVARLPRVQMAPVWSVDVNGSVSSIERAGDGVLVVLGDGDAYRIDARTGQPTALAAVGARWTVSGDLLLAGGKGGPIPVYGWPPEPAQPTTKAKGKAKAPPKDDDIPRPPRLVTPIPPPVNLERSWQQTVFAATGPLLSRNDYVFVQDPTPADERGPGAPLLLRARDFVLVLDTDGNPLRRVQIPGEVEPDAVFSVVVDGKPVTGALLANPLRVVLF